MVSILHMFASAIIPDAPVILRWKGPSIKWQLNQYFFDRRAFAAQLMCSFRISSSFRERLSSCFLCNLNQSRDPHFRILVMAYRLYRVQDRSADRLF
jgi:hypothetical protein